MHSIVYDTFINKMIKPGFGTDDGTVVYAGACDGFRPIFSRLESQPFICGDQLSIGDFMLFEAINYLNRMSDDPASPGQPKTFVDFPYLKAYHEKIGQLPGLKQYFEKSEASGHPYLPAAAKLKL